MFATSQAYLFVELEPECLNRPNCRDRVWHTGRFINDDDDSQLFFLVLLNDVDKGKGPVGRLEGVLNISARVSELFHICIQVYGKSWYVKKIFLQ